MGIQTVDCYNTDNFYLENILETELIQNTSMRNTENIILTTEDFSIENTEGIHYILYGKNTEDFTRKYRLHIVRIQRTFLENTDCIL